MVKLLLSVVAIVISLYCAFYCGVFEKTAQKQENLCYGELGTVRDPKRYPRFNVRESRNWESNRDQSPARADEPSSKTPSLCPPRNFERLPQSLSPPVERFGPKFSATNVESSEEDCYCVDDKDDLYFPRQLIDPSVKDLDYAKSPRATSTRLVSDDLCKKSSQQTSSGNKKFASTYGKSLCDIEKCCNLFFGSDKKNDIDNISSGDKAERLDILPVNSVGRVKNVAAEGELVPPDGGWGWLVLLASVMVNVLIPGTIKSFGVLFVEFLEVFDASPAAAAWIPSLCYFLYSSLGPLSSILSVKYSYRTVTLIGGTFAAAGMMLSYFASSVGFLCVSYGVFVGIGAGLSFPPTVYIVTSYFVRFRGLANGLCISGSALGSIFLPPILGFLLEEYGYRGAVLLMGAVTLNVWASALLYEPVEKHMKRVPISSEPEDEDEMEAGMAVGTSPEDEKKLNNLLIIPNSKTDVAAPIVPKSASSVALENYKNTPIQGRTRKISVPTGRDLASQMHSTPALYAVPERGGFESGRLSKRRTAARSPSSSSFNYVSTPYHGSTLSVLHPEHASTMTLHAITRTFARKSPEKTVKTKPRSNAKFFDISLLKDPVYLVILISNSTNAVSYTNFVILLPAYAISLHFDKHMSWLLLSTVSVLDLIGRIGGSALSDIQIMPKHWYFVGGLFVSGISLALLPLATSYIWLSIYCGVFGLASGIYVGVTAVIMADMLGTEKLTSSYGISLFVNGVLQLVGPPICGLIFEHIGSYGPIFSILGIILVAGASLWGFMPLIKRRQRLAATAAQADKL